MLKRASISTHIQKSVRASTLQRGSRGGKEKQKEQKKEVGELKRRLNRCARRPCCVGFICVLVYLVGGGAATVAAAVAAAAAVAHRPWSRQSRCRFLRCPPDAAAVQCFCRSV